MTWISAAGGSWSTAADWSTGALPQSGDDVVINQPGKIQITLSGSVSVKSVTITGDTLVLQTGATLTTSGAVSNSGTITVNASAQLAVGGSYTESAGATLSMPGGGATSEPTSNQFANTGFESPVITTNGTTSPAGWSTWGSSYLSNQYAYTGAQSLQTSGANSGVLQNFSVTPGASYTLSAYAMTPAAAPLTGSEEGSLELIFFTSSGAQISSYTPPNSVQELSATSSTGGPLAGTVGSQGWNLFSTTAVAPSNAATVDAILGVGAYNGSGAGGGSVCWDAPQFGPAEPGPSKVTAASISNSGAITVGPSNTLTSSGTSTQTSTASLDVQLGGSPASGDFGYVSASGAVSLAGTLKSDIVYGYVPSTTDVFTVMEFPSETGSFAMYALGGSTACQFQGAVSFTNVVLAAEPTAALTTTVNAASNLHPVKTNLLGVNLAYWYGDATTTQTQQLVEQAGLNIYRFPGGSASDDYHFNVSDNYGDPAAQTIPQFAQFIQAVGGTGMITVDYGSGSPQEAAAEMAYLEGSTSDTTSIGTGIEWNDSTGAWQNVNWGTVGYWAGLRAASPLGTDDGLNFLRIDHPAPFSNIKYWEIGNEEYGSWEVDHHGTAGPGSVSTGAQHDPETYVTFAKAFSTYAAEIVANAGLASMSIGIDSDDPTGASDNNWTKNVLSDGLSIGFVPNYISDHNYTQGPGEENDSFLLNDTVSNPLSLYDWSVRYADYQTLLSETLSSQASSVALMATEFNSVYTDPGKQSTSLVNGLFVADSIGSLLDSGYTGGIVWDLRNGYDTTQNNSEALYGWRNGGDYGILGDPNVNQAPTSAPYVPYPSYFGEQLASKIIDAGGEAETASTNYQDFHAYSVMEADGHLDLLVINTNPAASLTEQFNLTGFQPSGTAQLWQYGEAQDTAQSQSSTGAAALSSASTTLSLTGSSFSYSFPAYSMTVIDLTPLAVTSVSPSSGPVAGGTSVVITGSGFTGATAVKFGGVAAISFTVNSATQITAVDPAGTAGIVDVQVTVPSGSTSATSTADQFTYVAPSGAASYVGTDSTTQGSWKGVYGSQGEYIADDSSTLPSYASLSDNGGAAYVWNPSTSDARCLEQDASTTNRIASTLYNNSAFSVGLNLTDGNTHQVELYVLDYDYRGRAETINVLNASGGVLASQSASNFSGGEYAIFDVSGDVTFQIISTGNYNAVLSGLFIDAPVAANPGAASYVRTDSTTQGNWKGVYGSQGEYIVDDSSTLPSYASMSDNGGAAYVWSANTSDARCLEQDASTTNRIASTLYNNSAFSVGLNLTDGNTHQVELYLLDYDYRGRAETINVLNASGAVLASQSVSNFSTGQYVIFDVSGDVTFQFVSTGNYNAVLSGLFIDAPVAANPGTASYVSTDTTTQGSWKGVYGSQGEYIVDDSSTLPSDATLSDNGGTPYAWSADTSDGRCLEQDASTTNRIASTLYNNSAFSVGLNLTDGNTHQVALYVLDYDYRGRAETINVLNASGVVLATRSVSNFSGGQYVIFDVSGDVTFQFISTGNYNAVLSGLFIG